MDSPMPDAQETLDASPIPAAPRSAPDGWPLADAGWPLATRLARRRIHELLESLAGGRLHLGDALGLRRFGTAHAEAPDVALQIHDPSTYVDIATGGSIGAAEAYMAGKWTTSDLTGVMRLLASNRELLLRMEQGLSRTAGTLLKLMHWFRRNTRAGSRRNISAHYDLGDEMFSMFLDPAMMYSAAVFPRADATLEQASLHKLDLVCRKLGLSPDDHLLEIGSGWGGLALHAASRYGCRVTTTTISENQFAVATRRVREAGLADRVTVLAADYRDLDGRYDKLVSIEMIEAVGHRFLDEYARVCSARLKPHGRMLLQAIVMADRHFDQARRSVDFIQKYIFPGGALPSLATIMRSIGRMTDLQMTDVHDIGLDYARTLELWRGRFLARVADIRRLGYPDEFVRMWEWYFAYCEGGFLERAISAVQLVLDKPGCRLTPWRTCT